MQKTFSCPVCGTRYRHKGMALGEKLDDGRSAADLLALAQTVPCILGRTG